MGRNKENVFVRYLKAKIKMQIWWKGWWRDIRKNTSAKALLLLTPLHGNLGDQALAIADFNFLKRCGITSDEVLEIPTAIVEGVSNSQIRKIVGNRIIFVQAGGFIGNTWMNEERQVQRCLKICSKNTIIILPQTITFTSDKEGESDKRKMKKILDRCQDITICVREMQSVKEAYELGCMNKVLVMPDMVIGFMPEIAKSISRKNECLFCMRQDREKSVSDNFVKNVEEEISRLGLKIKYTNTLTEGYVYPEEREQVVNEKLIEFSSVKLVITDRLHGMLFAAITSTPCLFFDNLNHKVSNVYDWINVLKYIKPIESLNSVKKDIKDVMNNNNLFFSKEEFLPKYESLIKYVEEKFEEYI